MNWIVGCTDHRPSVGSVFEVGTVPVHLTVRVQPKTVQIRSIEP
jgi:hypothetical protein